MASLIKRGSTYYLQDRLSGRIKRTSRHTDSHQFAKEKLRQYESAKLRGLDSPLPTRTPIADVRRRIPVAAVEPADIRCS